MTTLVKPKHMLVVRHVHAALLLGMLAACTIAPANDATRDEPAAASGKDSPPPTKTKDAVEPDMTDPGPSPAGSRAPAPTPPPKPTPTPTPAPGGSSMPQRTTENLIVNGDAEAAVGSANGTAVETPGWASAGNATAVQYGTSGGYPLATDPGPIERGNNFLCGGASDELSSLSQTIDLSAWSAEIDHGGTQFQLAGWLGGYAGQADFAVLEIVFEDANGEALESASIGPVSTDERGSATGLLERKAVGAVPPETRTVTVTLSMVRSSGSNNDGYADDLSLVLLQDAPDDSSDDEGGGA